MDHVTLAALRRPSGNHTVQLDLGERISRRQVCWLDFYLLDTARVICRRREPQVRRRFHQNSLHSVEAFSQLLTDMGKYTHIRPSPGPPLGKIFLEGIRKKAEKTSKQHSSMFSAFGSWLFVPSVTVEASKGSVTLLNRWIEILIQV